MPFRTPQQKSEYDKRRYRERRDELLVQKKAYYEANKERLIAAGKERADPDAKRDYDRAHNAKPEVKAKRAAQRRAWRIQNPSRTKAHNRARSFVRRGSRPDADARAYIEALVNDPCCYCKDAHQHVDHIIPLAAGGDSCWENLTSACKSCNHRKRDKPLLIALLEN